MDKKTAKEILDTHAPGWAKAQFPAIHIKTTADPKHRQACHKALAAHGPVKADKIAKAKPKAKAKATPKTTTKKEG
tara:strand:+ start:2720 stop:2947 length:228 start_codon:yes stop_codon:yes gene_type:complete